MNNSDCAYRLINPLLNAAPMQTQCRKNIKNDEFTMYSISWTALTKPIENNKINMLIIPPVKFERILNELRQACQRLCSYYNVICRHITYKGLLTAVAENSFFNVQRTWLIFILFIHCPNWFWMKLYPKFRIYKARSNINFNNLLFLIKNRCRGESLNIWPKKRLNILFYW